MTSKGKSTGGQRRRTQQRPVNRGEAARANLRRLFDGMLSPEERRRGAEMDT
jgi:hypothetical protein